MMIRITDHGSYIKPTLTCEGGFKLRFQQIVSTKRAQLIVAVLTVRLNGSFIYVKTWVNADLKRLGIPSLVKSNPSCCSISFRQYLPLCWLRTVPLVSEEEGTYTLGFYQVLLFTSRAFARFHWHSYTVASSKVLSMPVFDSEKKVLDTVNFFSIPLVTWTLAVRRSLYGERK